MADRMVIETANLRKTYPGIEALRGLDLQVPAGSICGFVGRNGAGKTTTMKILLGMVRPTSGEARVFGAMPDVEVRRRVGFMSEEKDLYGYMTVEEMIRFTAPFFPRWRADLEKKYLRQFELPPDRKIKVLSRGMRTKLALLLALCRGAELLIVDEPTSGLDPAMAEEALQAVVGQVADEHMTVFFSSHQIAEVEQIADRVAIIDHGRLVMSGELDKIRENFRRIQVVFEGDAPQMEFRAPGVTRVRREGRVLTLLASGTADSIIDEVRALNPLSVDVKPVTFKEIFLETVSAED